MISKLRFFSFPKILVLGGLAVFTAGGCGSDDDDASSESFSLREGTEVMMRLVGVQAPQGVSITYRLREDLLAEPGDTGVIGVAVEDLHVHGEWSVTVPADIDPDELMLGFSFILESPDEDYRASSEIMAHLAFHHEGEDDDHNHEGEDDDEGEDDHEHGDMVIAATGADGGQLLLEYDFAEAPIELEFNRCIGGVGEECDGGLLLYSTADPGFAPLE